MVGHLLSVACADNTIRIISAYSGKTVHHYPAYQSDGESSPPVKVTCLGWGVNFTDSKAAKRHLHDAAGQVNIEDLLSPDNHPSKAAALLKADLPRELALLDVESSLPKLSTLPATGSEWVSRPFVRMTQLTQHLVMMYSVRGRLLTPYSMPSQKALATRWMYY